LIPGAKKEGKVFGTLRLRAVLIAIWRALSKRICRAGGAYRGTSRDLIVKVLAERSENI